MCYFVCAHFWDSNTLRFQSTHIDYCQYGLHFKEGQISFLTCLRLSCIKWGRAGDKASHTDARRITTNKWNSLFKGNQFPVNRSLQENNTGRVGKFPVLLMGFSEASGKSFWKHDARHPVYRSSRCSLYVEYILAWQIFWNPLSQLSPIWCPSAVLENKFYHACSASPNVIGIIFQYI